MAPLHFLRPQDSMKYYINCHLAVAEEMSHQTVQVLSGAFMLLSKHHVLHSSIWRIPLVCCYNRRSKGWPWLELWKSDLKSDVLPIRPQRHGWHTGVFASRIISPFTFAPMGSSRVSKQAKIFKELEFLGLGRYFSFRIEESWKTSKIQPKTAVWG